VLIRQHGLEIAVIDPVIDEAPTLYSTAIFNNLPTDPAIFEVHRQRNVVGAKISYYGGGLR